MAIVPLGIPKPYPDHVTLHKRLERLTLVNYRF